MNHAKVLLLLCAVPICGLLLWACGAAENESGSQDELVGRWHFASPAIADEWQRKQDRLKSIDQFWVALERDAPKLLADAAERHDETAIAKWAQQHIQNIHPDLMFEFGPVGKDGAVLTITPESKAYLRPIVDTLMERKKPIPGWTFQTYREGLPPETIASAFEARVKQPLPPPFTARCTIDDDNSIRVEFVGDKYTNSKDPIDWLGPFGVCEVVLGEEENEKWLGMVLPVHGDAPAESDMVKCAQQFKDAYFETKKKLLAKIPVEPYWQQTKPKSEVVIDFGKTPEGRNTVLTPYQALFTSLGRPTFTTERFSRCGERFAYLQVDGNMGLSADVQQRDELAQAIDTALRGAKLGCVVGSGSGTPDRSYIDLMLTDPDKAVPVLQEVARSRKLPHSSWLRFYDADWRQEWVGMFNDTTPPADPRKMW